MVHVRKETQNVSYATGSVYRKLLSSWQTDTRTMSWDYREDIVPRRADQFFTTTKFRCTGGIANGTSAGCIYENWPVIGINGMAFAHMTTPGTPSDAIVAAKVAAETNPSQPIVDVGQSLAEMREIPASIKRRGVDLYNSFNYKNRTRLRALILGSKAGADLNLRFQFGIRPIVSDLFSLVSIRKSLNNKIRDLIRVEKNGGMIRKRTVYEETRFAPGSGSTLLVSHLGASDVWRAWIQTTTTRRKWCYVRWLPDGTRKLPYHKDRGFQRRFYGKMLGLDLLTFRSVWNIMPWSWLADWCSNVGDYVAANDNQVGIKLGSICVCEYEHTVQHFRFTTKPKGVEVDDCVRIKTTKTRRNVTLTLSARWPLLSIKQVGILASIANK